jgi:hypothetical protein
MREVNVFRSRAEYPAPPLRAELALYLGSLVKPLKKPALL